MLSKDVYSLLGLCARARQLTSGSSLINDIRKKKVSLVIVCEDASDNTKKKITDKCQFYQIECLILADSQKLSLAIGKENRMAVGIMDRGFANKIKSKLGG